MNRKNAWIFYCRFGGGLFYLLNKVLLALSEGKVGPLRRKLKITGWITYLIGVPAWAVILVGNHDWIAASIQVGAIPAMLLGVYSSYNDQKKTPKRFIRIVGLCTYSALFFGILCSVRHHGGMLSTSQILELGVMFGFLLGSFLMAKKNPLGWLFFMPMNLCMAALMFLEDQHIMMAQQLVSLGFVIYGLKTHIRHHDGVLLAV